MQYLFNSSMITMNVAAYGRFKLVFCPRQNITIIILLPSFDCSMYPCIYCHCPHVHILTTYVLIQHLSFAHHLAKHHRIKPTCAWPHASTHLSAPPPNFHTACPHVALPRKTQSEKSATRSQSCKLAYRDPSSLARTKPRTEKRPIHPIPRQSSRCSRPAQLMPWTSTYISFLPCRRDSKPSWLR